MAIYDSEAVSNLRHVEELLRRIARSSTIEANSIEFVAGAGCGDQRLPQREVRRIVDRIVPLIREDLDHIEYILGAR
jgi:hypothetical protein